MSSVHLSEDGKGRRLIINLTGRRVGRHQMRLGSKASKATWNEYHSQISRIVNAFDGGSPLGPSTLEWLREIPESRYEQLAKWGLVESRASDMPFVDYIRQYVNEQGSREGYAKETRIKWKSIISMAERHFGPDVLVSGITPAIVSDFMRVRRAAKGKRNGTLSQATIARQVSYFFQVMAQAERDGLVRANPFAGISRTDPTNRRGEAVVDDEHVDRLIRHLERADDRLVVGMARYAAVRVPSELQDMKVGDWHRDKNIVRVLSPKTKKCGKPDRPIVLEPKLTLLLEQCVPSNASPDDWMFPCLRSSIRNRSKNVRDRILKVMSRLGIKPWPSLFHGLRRAGTTQWADQYLLSETAAMTGNTPRTIEKHYLNDRGMKRLLEEAKQNLTKAEQLRTGGTCGGTSDPEKPVAHPVAHPPVDADGPGSQRPERSHNHQETQGEVGHTSPMKSKQVAGLETTWNGQSRTFTNPGFPSGKPQFLSRVAHEVAHDPVARDALLRDLADLIRSLPMPVRAMLFALLTEPTKIEETPPGSGLV